MVILLVLLAAGSAGWFVHFITRDSSDGSAAAPGDPGYVCYKCGKTFTLAPDAYAEQVIDPVIARKDPTAARRPHCPLCHAKHAGFMMVSCLTCGKSYLPPTKMPRGSAVAAEAKDVCPHCKTDRGEDYRNRKSRGSARTTGRPTRPQQDKDDFS